MSSHLEYRPDIDGLRAIAVLAVIGFHAFPEFVPGGFVGVDVFFVISGYLISGIILKSLDENSFSISGFYSRRIRRIFPALIIVLLICLVGGWFLLFADEYKQLGVHTVAGSSFVSNFALWHEAGYFDGTATSKPLLHLWSLGIEEQFYLLWPVLLLVLYRIHPRSIPLAIAGIALSSFLLGAITVDVDPTEAFYSPASRLWELLFGSALAARSDRVDRFFGTNSRNVRSALGLGCMVIAFFAFDKDFLFPGWWALLPVVGAFLVISAGSTHGLNRTFLSASPLVKIGLISFPLYLWHWPLISFAHIIESGQPSVFLRSTAVAASFLLAWVTYRYVEIPVRRRPNPKVTIYLVTSLVMVGAIGFQIKNFDGIPSRSIQDAQHFNIEKIGKERLASMRAGHCHFYRPDDTFAGNMAIIGDCLSLDAHRKNILVIGDSHAFDLRTSLSQAYKEINFLQVTGSGCTPIEAVHKPDMNRCGELVRYVKYDFKELVKLDGVILSARWSNDFKTLTSDIEYFQMRGIPVVVFGPTFEFSDDVPKILSRNRSHKPNLMLSSYLLKDKFRLDVQMEKFFNGIGVSYVSKINNLCAGEVCPALSENQELFILDYGHWSPDGSKYYGEIFRANHVLEKWLNPNEQLPRSAPPSAISMPRS